MAIPVYLFLTDNGGAKITGSVDVRGREGSIEVSGFTHNLRLPTDPLTGKITSKRSHAPVIFQKEIDSSSPYLMKAVATGQTLNYGAVGAAAGIPDGVLLRGAGTAQILAGTSAPVEFAKYQDGNSYGDDPVDQLWIRTGIDYARKSGF
ncbi:type VI secretion system tube protein TssD [Enterobacter oligotrophicus]